VHDSDTQRRRAPALRARCCAVLLAGSLAGLSAGAAAAGEGAAEYWFPVRTHNPFLQIYGLPVFQGAGVLEAGAAAWQFTLDIANHADDSSRGGESITLDGESYFVNLSYRRGISDWLELGIDVPLIAHADGVLDPAIESWHDLWGMSNAKRTGPDNELSFVYERAGMEPYVLDDGSAGVGDVRLNAAVPLAFGWLPPASALTLKAGLKLPTGDAEKLHGSGAADLSLAAYYSAAAPFGLERLDISAHAGVLLTGDSDLFAPIQETTVPFGGAAADWRFSDRLRAVAAVYAQGEYVDSRLDELGSSLQLIVGGDYRFSSGLSLSFGIVEELFSDATVDFAFQLSLRHKLGGGA
jgi:hypothetical protein